MEHQSNLSNSTIAQKTIDLNKIKKIDTNTDSKCKFNELSWSCFFCAYVSKEHKELQHHFMNAHHIKKEFMRWRCTDCGKIFDDYALFLNHLRLQHYNHLMKSCDICGKLQRSYMELAKHRIKHHDNTEEWPLVFNCLYCYEVFSNQDDLKNHIITFDNGEENFTFENPKRKTERFSCRFCAKQLFTAVARANHENCHVGNKPYTCCYCFQGFSKIKLLHAHENRVRLAQRHECECGEIFEYSCQYKMHSYEHAESSAILAFLKTEYFPGNL